MHLFTKSVSARVRLMSRDEAERPRETRICVLVKRQLHAGVQSCRCKTGLADWSQSRLLETSVSSLIIGFISQDAALGFNVVSGDDSGPLVRKDLSKQGKLCFSPQLCSFKMGTIRTFLTVIKIYITVIQQLAFELKKFKWVLHTHTHTNTHSATSSSTLTDKSQAG